MLKDKELKEMGSRWKCDGKKKVFISSSPFVHSLLPCLGWLSDCLRLPVTIPPVFKWKLKWKLFLIVKILFPFFTFLSTTWKRRRNLSKVTTLCIIEMRMGFVFIRIRGQSNRIVAIRTVWMQGTVLVGWGWDITSFMPPLRPGITTFVTPGIAVPRLETDAIWKIYLMPALWRRLQWWMSSECRGVSEDPHH